MPTDEKPNLLMTVGLPYSGKSMWARNQFLPIVSPDAIRIALHGQRYSETAEPFVWLIAKTMVRSLFLAGHHTVILDACNNTVNRRSDWKSPHWKRVFHVLDTPFDVCMERAERAGDDAILLSITRMAASHEGLTPDDREEP